MPRIIDNDRDEIRAELDGREIRSWEYNSEGERRVKMRMAHEFAEGWFQASRHMAPDDDERPDEPSPEEMRRMKALYDAEKAAGLHRSRAEHEADLIAAGRGHLIRRE